MTRKVKKLEPKFGLDMPFDEAVQRFIQTDPRQVKLTVEMGKRKKPRRAKRKRKKPGGKKMPPGSGNVISLRDRRMRKRNYGR